MRLLLVSPEDSMSLWFFGCTEPFFFFTVHGISLVAASRSDFLVTCVQASYYWSYCCCREQALEHRLSTCVTRAYLLRGMWHPLRPGIIPGSYALAGRLFTTGPPGKCYSLSFNWALCMLIHSQAKLGSSTNNWEI